MRSYKKRQVNMIWGNRYKRSSCLCCWSSSIFTVLFEKIVRCFLYVYQCDKIKYYVMCVCKQVWEEKFYTASLCMALKKLFSTQKRNSTIYCYLWLYKFYKTEQCFTLILMTFLNLLVLTDVKPLTIFKQRKLLICKN